MNSVCGCNKLKTNGSAAHEEAAVVSPDLNEQSFSQISPQLSVCQGGGKTQPLSVNLAAQ